VELINLYTGVNEQIIKNQRQSRLFVRVTETLREIRQTIDRIEVKINFQHIWFPQGKFHSFWSYYNKINIESEKPD
jgi:hypothetical protein